MSKRIRTINDAANVVRGRRIELGLSQEELARRSGVSRKWINQFEAGKPSAELHLVMRVLDAVDVRIVFETTPDFNRDAAIDLDALLDEQAGR